MFPQTLALVGNRWSTTLLGAAFDGAVRFGEFAGRLHAPPSIIADRINSFCELGVFTAVRSPDRSHRFEYHLTDKGRALWPVVMLSIDWGQRWFHSPEGPAMTFQHVTGAAPQPFTPQPFTPQPFTPRTFMPHTFTPRLACGRCATLLRGEDIVTLDR